MADREHLTTHVYIKVYQGSVLKKAPPRERYVQIMPSGQAGAVYKGRVYPLYQQGRINLLDEGALTTDCYQAPDNEATSYLMTDLPVFPYGWLRVQGVTFKLQLHSASLAFDVTEARYQQIVQVLSNDYAIHPLPAGERHQWRIAIKPRVTLSMEEVEPRVVQLLNPLLTEGKAQAASAGNDPETLKRQLAEAHEEIASLRKELLAARQRVLQLSMSNPQPR